MFNTKIINLNFMNSVRRPEIHSIFHEYPDYREVLKSYFSLNEMEFTVFVAVHQLGESDIDQILESTGHVWHKNKVNSALKKLVEIELCSRQRIGGKGMGFKHKYIYTGKEISEIKQEIEKNLEEWLLHVKREMSDLVMHLNSVDLLAKRKKKDKVSKVKEEWFDSTD